MISKWFLGVSAKSKGFFKGWQYEACYYGSINNYPLHTTARPAFTKQTALATSYDTENDAKSELAEIRKTEEDKLNKAKKKYKIIKGAKHNWSKLTVDERLKICYEINPLIKYDVKSTTSNRNFYSYHKYINFFVNNTPRTLTESEIDVVNKFDWKPQIENLKSIIELYKNRINFCDNKIVIRQEEIGFKFIKSERSKISWELRGEHDTVGNYCNCCGGAVPNIPYFCLKNNWGGNKIYICCICMTKIAEQTKIQAKKIPKEIFEHYQAERFLEGMD